MWSFTVAATETEGNRAVEGDGDIFYQNADYTLPTKHVIRETQMVLLTSPRRRPRLD